ncbi:MAG TPA: DnaJ domain-containing protein [Allosphingosinicella sp.]
MGWLLKAGLAVLLGFMIYTWLRSRIRHATAMPATEARALLGVGEAASLKEIRDAHRRLIAKVHPDAGGSAELATRVNAARDALVAELNRRTPRAS